ncbi:MAG: hypothetical protein WBZ04_14125 [Candidatus Nanopelagicales bacterium]
MVHYPRRASSEVQVSESGRTHRGLHIGSFKIDIATWVYGTVTLMSALVIYEGWTADIRFLGVVTIVIGTMHRVGDGAPLCGGKGVSD